MANLASSTAAARYVPWALLASHYSTTLMTCRTASQAITIVQRSFRQKDEAEEMEALGFGPVKLVGSAAVYMAGEASSLGAAINLWPNFTGVAATA